MTTSRSGTEEKRLRLDSETSRTLDESLESPRNEGRGLESRTSPSNTLTDSIQPPGISDPLIECQVQEQGMGGLAYQLRDDPSFSGSAMHVDQNEEMVIMSIRATDVSLGFRRAPAGFYTAVAHSGHEWRTENKRSSVNDDVVDWSGPIPIPSDLSATIRIEVYASFEFQPMLAAGEQLRRLTITAEQLLDRSGKGIPLTFFPRDGDVVSPCSSVLVTVKQYKRESSDPLALGPHCSTTESRGELEDATNKGHSALSRYRKYGGKRNLERSIEQFERALNICPLHHPGRAAAQSNLAISKFILCQVEDTNASLEVPLRLYRNALAARPVGHVDRPSTLIQLATVHFARFEKQRDASEGARAEALLHEAIDLGSAESHESRAATFMLQLHAAYKVVAVQPSGQSVEQGPTSCLMGEDLWILSFRLLQHYPQSRNLADLQQAIAMLQELVKFAPVWDDRRYAGLGNLGLALLHRSQHLGRLSDLEDAILTLRETVNLTPHGHRQKRLSLYNLALCFHERFRHLGQLSDVEAAISTSRDALDLTPYSQPDMHDYLSNLGTSFFTRFKRLGELPDLEEAISRYRSAVDFTPHDHPGKPGHLNQLGVSLAARFERLGELSDLEDAIAMLSGAVELTPYGDPDKPARLGNLGSIFKARFERLGMLGDLQDAVSILKDAIELTPPDHPEMPIHLNNLGNCLAIRFKTLGDLSDLEEAILRQRKAVDVTSQDDIHRPIFLDSLGNSYRARFERLGELSDLDAATSTLKDAVDSTPHGHPKKLSRLNSLGNSFNARFARLGMLSDLEAAISTLRNAIDLIPHGHPERASCLKNLGDSFLARFGRLGELHDLEDAILRYSDAVDVTPRGHPNEPMRLDHLGRSFLARFERLGELVDLDNAISRHRGAVDLIPHGHPHRPTFLKSLGNSFLTRFRRLGELSDLETAIIVLRDAIDLTPPDHPNQPGQINNLGLCYRSRFECLGELGDLKTATLMLRDAIQLTPHGHPDKPIFVSNLGNCFRGRFSRFGELSDLEAAISMFQDANDLTPPDHPDKLICLNNLGTCFFARFERRGELSDVDAAISAFRNAVDLISRAHPHMTTFLNNLGASFFTRFEQLGDLSDLETAISTLRDVVDLTPPSFSEKHYRLHNLGSSYLRRFERLGELSDLQAAISLLANAVELIPHSHSLKPTYLSSLGSSLSVRFERLGELTDLEAPIPLHKAAVDLTPPDHPDKYSRLNNLGGAFLKRFEHIGELTDLDAAISTLGNAVDLTPHDHPHRPGILNSFGLSFQARFKLLGELRDLEVAISVLRDAVNLTPHDYPAKLTFLNSLGGTLCTRFDRFGKPSDLEQAISLYSHVASASIGPINTRFRASQKWISCARRIDHHSLLHAYSTAISLLPQLAWIGLPVTYRYTELVQGADVVREAAAAALDAGLPETAVEWLEQGRSIVWGELLQLRSSYEELSSVHPDHARRLRELSAALEHASTTHEKSFSALLEDTRTAARGLSATAKHPIAVESATHRAIKPLEQEAAKHRMLAIERDKLLQEIRGFPGFEQFLLRKEFSQLRVSAHSGPVVMLNAAKSRCDALVVLANVDHVIHIPLSNFTLKQSTHLLNTMKNFIRHARAMRSGEREGERVRWEGIRWESFLAPLWKSIVKPVLDALAFSIPGDQSRIFWCPTGPFSFLPIHAAGFYDTGYLQPGHKVFDFVVSSYVPSLAVLAPSSSNPPAVPSSDLRFLAVRQPPSDGLPQLPGVHTELKHISEVIRDSPAACTTLLESSIGTVEEVLSLMKGADWVHFACHGIQDAVVPAQSGLCLADQRRLKISDMMGLSRSRGGLAFLSACQTATGDERLSDEAIHITAGMLFAGYGSAIGTMWSISDRLAPIVARDVYDHLFRNGNRPDYREAARALHDAMGYLRESCEVSFDEWIPFIHVGL